MPPLEILLSSTIVGVAVSLFVFAGEPYFGPGIDFLEKDFREKLRRMRMKTDRLRTYLIAWLLICVMIAMIGWIGFGMPVLGVGLATLCVGLPWYLVRRAAERRKEKLEDQLADAMVSMSSSIRAGLSLSQAMEILARQCPWPINQEFTQVYGEYQMGKTMETCLLEAKERIDSENFALFVAAMEASRRSGGRLNETVERIAGSVRELQRLERKIKSETAQARASATYMAMAPIAVLAMYYFILDPKNTERLFTTVAGQLILITAAILNIIAYLWARAILNPEI